MITAVDSSVLLDVFGAGSASVPAERLLTRDGGFYRTAFADLLVLDPAAIVEP